MVSQKRLWHGRSMGRVAKIESGTVLTRAMKCFWTKGYVGTSVQDLVSATGLDRGSLYLRHKNKEALFLAAMQHYRDEVVGQRRKLIDGAPTARAGIETFFAEILKPSIDGQFLGCLNTNTATDVHPTLAPKLFDVIRKGFLLWHAYWVEVVKRGIKDGSLSPTINPQAVAASLLVLTQGSNVVTRGLGDSALPKLAVRSILDALLSGKGAKFEG
jgi:TetR/AcrR family transcriptional regulator, transcriptional repressor for nem operon